MEPYPNQIVTLPFDYIWSVDDHKLSDHPSYVAEEITWKAVFSWRCATGIPTPDDSPLPAAAQHVGIVGNNLTHAYNPDLLLRILHTTRGDMRKLLALLACINDVPVGVRHVEPTHGFVAQGRYRKFLSHSVISLNLPKGRDPQKIARQIVAAAKRRAHQVRGHYRQDWRHPLAGQCAHEFDGHMICRFCGGHKIWIAEHQRGDASLGFVTHDYAVKHEEA